MSILDQVMDMKNKGVSEGEIINSLKEQGISPKAINDALGQARIKGAVSNSNEEGMTPSIMRPERAEELPTEGSISDEDLTPLPNTLPPGMQQRGYFPMHKEVDEEYVPQPGENYETQYPSYQPQEQEYYPQQGESYQPGMVSADTDMIIEVSEQVFAERMKGAVKQIESFNEFKTLSQSKIDNISERLRRIESTIDTLQIAILEKIGAYGRGIDSIKKEMEMMEDSFSKVVKTATEKHQHHHNSEAHSSGHEHNASSHSHTQTHVPVQRIEKRTTVVHKSSKKKK